MSTILGENISLVRPGRYHRPIVPKETHVIHYNTRAKTRKIGKREMQQLIKLYEEKLNEPTKVAPECCTGDSQTPTEN